MLAISRLAVLVLVFLAPVCCASVTRCASQTNAGCPRPGPSEYAVSTTQRSESLTADLTVWQTLHAQVVRPVVDHLTARRELHKRFLPLDGRDYLGFGMLLGRFKSKDTACRVCKSRPSDASSAPITASAAREAVTDRNNHRVSRVWGTCGFAGNDQGSLWHV